MNKIIILLTAVLWLWLRFAAISDNVMAHQVSYSDCIIIVKFPSICLASVMQSPSKTLDRSPSMSSPLAERNLFEDIQLPPAPPTLKDLHTAQLVIFFISLLTQDKRQCLLFIVLWWEVFRNIVIDKVPDCLLFNIMLFPIRILTLLMPIWMGGLKCILFSGGIIE